MKKQVKPDEAKRCPKCNNRLKDIKSPAGYWYCWCWKCNYM